MARLILVLSLLISGSVFANDPLIGSWRFTSMRYQDKEMPPMNPDLIITFEFDGQGMNRLHWERKGESGFCERRGQYQLNGSGQILSEIIVWTHPNNAAECAKDPDMQVGRQIVTPIKVTQGHIETELPLGDEKVIYIWKKL